MMKKNFKIFIGCLPGSTTKKDIESAFQKYGKITRIELKIDRVGNQKKCRGFGFVTFDQKQSFEKVLRSRICMEGRQLVIQPYLKGSNLKESRFDLIRRKIFVGNLPRKITDKVFRSKFQQFGELEAAYIIKSHVNSKNKRYGFVVFKESESAAKVLSAKVEIYGNVLVCEWSDRNSKTAKNNSSSDRTNSKNCSDNSSEVKKNSCSGKEKSKKDEEPTIKESSNSMKDSFLESNNNDQNLSKNLSHTKNKEKKKIEKKKIEKKIKEKKKIEKKINEEKNNSKASLRQKAAELEENFSSSSDLQNEEQEINKSSCSSYIAEELNENERSQKNRKVRNNLRLGSSRMSRLSGSLNNSRSLLSSEGRRIPRTLNEYIRYRNQRDQARRSDWFIEEDENLEPPFSSNRHLDDQGVERPNMHLFSCTNKPNSLRVKLPLQILEKLNHDPVNIRLNRVLEAEEDEDSSQEIKLY